MFEASYHRHVTVSLASPPQTMKGGCGELKMHDVKKISLGVLVFTQGSKSCI